MNVVGRLDETDTKLHGAESRRGHSAGGRVRRRSTPQFTLELGRYVIAFANIDTISIFFATALFGLLLYFIVVRKVVSDIIVIPYPPFYTSRDHRDV